MDLSIPKFETKTLLYDYLHENKEGLLKAKKESTDKVYKKADGFVCGGFVQPNKTTSKSVNQTNKGVISVKSAINSTMIMDSHEDVHLNGLWDDTLASKTPILHLQEHRMDFKSIIASGDDLRAEALKVTWKELGYNNPGETQLLVFNSEVREERNKYMYDQYIKNYVTNHSVGMRYDKLFLAIKEGDQREKDLYNQYIDSIFNKEYVENKGYFYGIIKASFHEGSAVPAGSNFVTPTLEVSSKSLISNDPDIIPEKVLGQKSFLTFL